MSCFGLGMHSTSGEGGTRKDDLRGASCLVVGFTNQGKPIHIVFGTKNEILVIITVYIPTPPKFKNPYERG